MLQPLRGKKTLYYMLIGHLILQFWIVELSALKYNIIHNLRSRISLEMIQSFILSLQMLHVTVNKLRDHQRPVIYSTTTPDVLSNRTWKDQEARDFTRSLISYIGLAGSPSGVDFKSLVGFFSFFNLIPRDCEVVSFISLICCMSIEEVKSVIWSFAEQH